MKIYNTMEEFLKENEIDNHTTQKILKECSKHNPNLAAFLEYKKWQEVPMHYTELFVQMYEASEVNMITGEIIKPFPYLTQIKMPLFDFLEFKLKIENDIDNPFPLELVFIEKDETEETLNMSADGQLCSEYIQFDYDESKDFVQKALIDMEEVHPAVKKIEVRVCDIFEISNFNSKKITFSLSNKTEKLIEIDLTNKHFDQEGIKVIELYWNLNTWTLNIIKS